MFQGLVCGSGRAGPPASRSLLVLVTGQDAPARADQPKFTSKLDHGQGRPCRPAEVYVGSRNTPNHLHYTRPRPFLSLEGWLRLPQHGVISGLSVDPPHKFCPYNTHKFCSSPVVLSLLTQVTKPEDGIYGFCRSKYVKSIKYVCSSLSSQNPQILASNFVTFVIVV